MIENEADENEVKYVAGCNVLGNLWHFEPTEHETFDEAKRALIREMLLEADIAWKCETPEGNDTADELAGAAEDVNLWIERDRDMPSWRRSTTAGGYEWFIAREGVPCSLPPT